jgi:CheY-like chemotaxis protein
MILPAAMNAIALQGADVGMGRILVVEDDRTFGETLCKVLGRAGYTTSLATDFQTALGILEADQPLDLLLVDIVMPDGINGIALSRMARMRRRDLKVIYITGYSIPGVEREALGPVLRKPVDNQHLIEEIARVLAE